MAIAANALAGLASPWSPGGSRLCGQRRWVVAARLVAEIALLVQVGDGCDPRLDESYTVPRFHMFYGFVGFTTVAIAYSSRDSMRGRLEMLYGLVGLFLMGIGIRASCQVR